MGRTIEAHRAGDVTGASVHDAVDKQFPPSTLAAQLLEHHATTQGFSHSKDSTTFRQLLNEIRACPTAVEADLQSSYKLISVVAEAGLHTPGAGEISSLDCDSTSQIIACLDVIQIALTRNAHVVFYAEPENDQPSSQLCFRLLPKLLSLLGRRDYADTHEQIFETLNHVGRTVCRSSDLWQDIPVLVQVLQAGVEDILLALSSPNQAFNNGAFDISFPSTTTLDLLFREKQRPIAVPGVQYARFLSTVHAVRAIACLTESVSALLTNAHVHASWPQQVSLKSEVWALKCMSELWGILRGHTSKEAFQRKTSLEPTVNFLEQMSGLALRASKFHPSTGLRERTAMCLLSCLSSVLSSPPWLTLDHALHVQLARIATILAHLCRLSPSIAEKARKQIVPMVSAVLNDEGASSKMPVNTKASLELILGSVNIRQLSSSEGSSPADHLLSSLFPPYVFEVYFCESDKGQLSLDTSHLERPSKRLKSSHGGATVTERSPQKELMDKLCSLLGCWSDSALMALPEAVQGLFADLDEHQKIETLQVLAAIPCAGHSKPQDTAGMCSSTTNRRETTWNQAHKNVFYTILTRLLDDASIQTSKRLKVLATIAVQEFASHSNTSEHLDLNGSQIGYWCIQGLRSSAREVRIAAGNALPSFLDSNIDFDEQLYRRNRVVALNALRNLSVSDECRIQETVIIALRQIASVCGSEEMNLILIQLVNYLGHKNPLICGLAHLELRQLAESLGWSVEELMKPYWRTIAVAVAKDLPGKPQKAQQLADLLDLSVNQLLILTQSQTVPFLILSRQADVVRKIAHASGDNTDPWSLCKQPQNLPRILAKLLTQFPDDFEVAAMGCLGVFKPDLQAEDLMALLKADPISVATDIFKIMSDEEGPGAGQAAHGFRELAAIVERRSHSTRTSTTQTRMTSLFFENHALGMMASFSDSIDNPSQPIIEKKRCLRGMKEMIQIAKNDIAIAVPQIHACLQSALGNCELCDDAFSGWVCLLDAVRHQTAEDLIEHTLTIVMQKWKHFSTDSQELAYNVIAFLFKSHGSFIQDNASLIPSLASIPMLSKFESQLSRLKDRIDPHQMFVSFAKRCEDENGMAVCQALRELLVYLEQHQQWIHDSASSEQPLPSVAKLTRSLLDASTRFNEGSSETLQLCGQCLGIIGCLDPNRVDTVKEAHEMILKSNFIQPGEAVDFVTFLLEYVLVKAFHAVSNPRAQGFLAYAMQELLRFCDLRKETLHQYHHSGPGEEIYRRWSSMPETVRNTLTPFLSSHYVLTTHSTRSPALRKYPIYTPRLSHGTWLRDFAFDLLQRPKGDNANMIFSVLARIIRGYDTSIASILLPFAAANIVIGGTSGEADDIGKELITVLREPTADKTQIEVDNLKLCSENVFQVLDYFSRWLQAKKKNLATARTMAAKTGRPMNELEEAADVGQIESVESIISSIPSDVIARRAVECGSYARALLHWEECIRQSKQSEQENNPIAHSPAMEELYARLQDIYTQIDDPDAIEGVSAHLQVLSPDQQVLEHRRAGRWAAAQNWYELQLRDKPTNLNLHADLMTSLCEGGQFSTVMRHAEHAKGILLQSNDMMSIFAQAAWSVEGWDALNTLPNLRDKELRSVPFNLGVGAAISALHQREMNRFVSTICDLRSSIMRNFSSSTTTSLQSCHDQLLDLHTLYECELVAGTRNTVSLEDRMAFHGTMTRRLDVMGSSLTDKQYLLSVRRAVMRLSDAHFSDAEMAGLWMDTAKLARKNNKPAMAYDAVIHALKIGEESAKIEQARLLWNEGEHGKAIKSLEGIIATNSFDTTGRSLISENASHTAANPIATGTTAGGNGPPQNLLVARAHLLLAKWLDRAGQTQSDVIMARYRQATHNYTRWEKGSYYLGRYYNKLLESEKALPPAHQHYHYLNGEMAKLVIENYLRSAMFGCKYLFQTVPKLLTLWLDFGVEVNRGISREVPDDVKSRAQESRPKMMETMNKQVKKYAEKIMPYIFYTALSQMISRISHPNPKVYELLGALILKVVVAHPQQALWSLLAIVKSSAPDRVSRGLNLLNRIKDRGKTVRNEGTSHDLRSLVMSGQKMSDELLHACEVPINTHCSTLSLTKDLNFKQRVAPCPLVVPVESTITPSLPTTATTNPQMKAHKPFPMSREAVTIQSFEDPVLILSSLVHPRKLTVRGSNGQRYGLLCKPNDDLRKDQRLMEFNAMINRSLKKDAEASKRRLYIKTYAVTPLNEACGVIEWVEGLKPMRDILIALYRARGIRVDYGVLKELFAEACSLPAGGHRVFTDTILQMYPPILHAWFAELFPAPDAWLAARGRYSRSCAVASMVGHALGLGDRHGENVLLEERTGGVFHVDFNCLFDKGLTFDKPELVPFRLTHNMVDACGATGVEGAWRRAAELAMAVMRANEDALLTIMETFVYDPTADFVGKTHRRLVKGAPETPKEMLESVRNKVRGLMAGESLPLSVQGHVDALVRQATDPARLCQMYIGWCAFL